MNIDDVTVILLAAGRGTRLTPYTKKTPKVLLKIDNETLIEKNINIVKNKLKKKEVHIIVGHYADEIINYLNSRKISGIKIIYHRISEKVLMEGISSSLLQISDVMDNYFLIMFGDEIYLHSDHDEMLEEISKRTGFDIYCMVKEASSPDEILKNYSIGISNGIITSLKEKPNLPVNNYAGLGTIVCSKNVLKIIESVPRQMHFIDALNHGIAENGLKAFYFISRCEYCNINDKDDYFLAKYLFRSKNMDNCKKSLIIPAYNEANTIGYVVKDFKKYVSEIIVMDNESPDGTGEIAKRAGAKVISKKYKGYGDAIRQGLEEADGDILVITEADATFLANDITKLLEYLKDSDAVIGTRTHRDFIQNNANMDYMLRIGNYLYGKIISLLWWDRRVRLSDVGCTYRALWRSSYEEIKDRLETNGPEFSPEMIVELLNSYLRIIEIPLSYCRRRLGESKISKSKWHSFIVALRMMHIILWKRLRSWANNLRFIAKIAKKEGVMVEKGIKGLVMGVFIMVLLVSWVSAEVKPKKSESKSKEAAKEEPKSTKETPAKEGNFLSKGSFEKWSILDPDNKGIPDGWQLGGDALSYREDKVKHDGEYSLRLSGSSGGAANIKYPYYEVQNFVGKRVTFTAYVKTDTTDAARLCIMEVSREKIPVPDGWQAGGDPIVTKEDRMVHDGTYALKLSGSQGGQANVNYPYIKTKDLSGKSITFTGYIKTDIQNAARLKIMEISKNGGVTEVYSDFHSGSGKWEELSVSKTLGSSIKLFVLTILNNAPSTEEFIYADTMGCNINNLLVNGDFEKWSKFAEREEHTETYSDFHSGSGNWERLGVSKAIGRFPSMLILTIFNFDTSPEDFIYVDEAQLVKE